MDFSRTTNNIVLEDKSGELVIQQIDILLDTDKGEVLGELQYGSDYDKFLYELNIGSEYIRDYVMNSLRDNVEFFDWNYDVEVQFMMGTKNDIILIGIEITRDSESYSKVYRIDRSVHDPDKTI